MQLPSSENACLAEPYPHGPEGRTRCSPGKPQRLTSLSERREIVFKSTCQARAHVPVQVTSLPVQVWIDGFMDVAPCVVPIFSDALPLLSTGVISLSMFFIDALFYDFDHRFSPPAR